MGRILVPSHRLPVQLPLTPSAAIAALARHALGRADKGSRDARPPSAGGTLTGARELKCPAAKRAEVEALLLWSGRLTGPAGVPVCAMAVVVRLSNAHQLAGFQVGVSLLTGMAAMLMGCPSPNAFDY